MLLLLAAASTWDDKSLSLLHLMKTLHDRKRLLVTKHQTITWKLSKEQQQLLCQSIIYSQPKPRCSATANRFSAPQHTPLTSARSWGPNGSSRHRDQSDPPDLGLWTVNLWWCFCSSWNQWRQHHTLCRFSLKLAPQNYKFFHFSTFPLAPRWQLLNWEVGS